MAETSLDSMLNSYAGKPAPTPSFNKPSDVDKSSEKKGAGTDIGSVIDTKQYRAGLSNINKSLEENREARKNISDPLPPTIALPPKQPQNDPMKTFGSSASFLAMFGSLMTKRPLISALNSGAAVQEAVNKKDAAAYKTAFDSWKAETDNAWKMADWNRNKLKDILDKYKDDDVALSREMEIWSKMTQDPTLDHMTKAYELKNHIAQLDKNTQELKKSLDNQTLQDNLAVDKVKEWKEKNGVTDDSKVPPDIFHQAQLTAKREVEAKGTSAMASTPTWTPDAIEKAADAVHGGLRLNIAVPGLGKNNPNRDAVMARYAEKYPDDDLASIEAGYAGKTSEARAVGTASGKIKLSANLLDKAIPLARDAVAKIDLTDYPSVNALENAARTQTGNPELAAAFVALQTVMSDYSALIARNGTSTNATREAARELVNQNMAKGQLSAVFDQMEKEKTNIIEATAETQGKKIIKKPDEKHIRMLRDDPSPEAMAEFDEVYGEGSSLKLLGE